MIGLRESSTLGTPTFTKNELRSFYLGSFDDGGLDLSTLGSLDLRFDLVKQPQEMCDTAS